MVKDRVFFDPGPLAFGKGCAYLLAFLTAVLFIKAEEKAYLFGIITYSCGCLCDYIEVASRKDKNKRIRQISAVLAILMVILVVIALGMAIAYDGNAGIKAFLVERKFWINLFLFVFWVIPMENGLWLIMKSIHDDDKTVKSNVRKTVSGFDIIP